MSECTLYFILGISGVSQVFIVVYYVVLLEGRKNTLRERSDKTIIIINIRQSDQ